MFEAAILQFGSSAGLVGPLAFPEAKPMAVAALKTGECFI